MADLIATKTFRYGTRALKAGQTFSASPAHARILKAIGKARDGSTPQADPLDGLRSQYEKATGNKADLRWKQPRLLSEIAKANEPKEAPKEAPTYERRDMRADGE